ncbi:recombinase family protein [Streptomyces sp. NBC_01180]|uniref:recombinase family protein n=1 Tax=Streptomyces sp. NBC_01180 TaxID=2903763 RepID=UPI0038657D9A|nr:recombinase family protein [Streptomyces sp. NBC_01180]
MTETAALYVRQSKRKADKSEASTEVQREESQRKADTLGCTTLPVYEDLGISGYDPTAERKGFDRMLRDARSGKFQRVIVYYMSRFSRQEPLEVLGVVRELWSYGITVTSVTEGDFVAGDFGSLISLLVRLEGNHKESHLKSINVKKTKDKARALGGYVGGGAPFGFSTRKELRNGVAVQVLEPHPVEGPIVAKLVARMLDSAQQPADRHGRHPASIHSAMEWMNSQPEAVPRRGASWAEATVQRILIDPRIAGIAAEYEQTRTYRILRDAEGEAIRMGPGIVSEADWYALQALLASRKAEGRASPGTSLLAGSKLLRCECGKLMVRFGPKGYPVNYRCPRARSNGVGRTHAGGNSIAAAHADDWVARSVLARITNVDSDDPDSLLLLSEATRRYGARQESAAASGERTELLQARAADTRSLEDLYDREEAGDYEDPVGRRRFRERKDRLVERLSASAERLRKLDEVATPLLPIDEWGGEPGGDPIGPGSWWAGAALDARRDMLRLFVDQITVTKATAKGGNRIGVQYDAGARMAIHWAKLE